LTDIILQMAPHTKAKHRILEEYLKRWLPILAKHNGRILYLDGFAGSGEYDDGSNGSPIIALEVASAHKLMLKLAKEVVFYFIEIDKGRFEHLQQLLDKKYDSKGDETYEKLPSNFKVGVKQGEFNKVIDSLLKSLDESHAKLAPTMAFIDPFGYSDINFDVLGRILRFKKCELLITYMVGYIDRFASELRHQPSIMKTLNITEMDIQAITAIPEINQRELGWMQLLTGGILNTVRNIDPSIQTIYHLFFRVLSKTNNTLYYLVYFTKSQVGVKQMKEAMWKIGGQGAYHFSDFDFKPGQTSILDYSQEQPWQREAADDLYDKFKGRTALLKEIERHVILNTPWIWRKKILELLEREDKIRVLGDRHRVFTYPEENPLVFK
jgi:three-Cys-motif partner protein